MSAFPVTTTGDWTGQVSVRKGDSGIYSPDVGRPMFNKGSTGSAARFFKQVGEYDGDNAHSDGNEAD